MESLCNKLAGPLPESLLKKDPSTDVFCDFWEILKNTFFTEPLWMTTSGSSGRYLKTNQNDINWGNISDFNGNTLHVFV